MKVLSTSPDVVTQTFRRGDGAAACCSPFCLDDAAMGGNGCTQSCVRAPCCVLARRSYCTQRSAGLVGWTRLWLLSTFLDVFWRRASLLEAVERRVPIAVALKYPYQRSVPGMSAGTSSCAMHRANHWPIFRAQRCVAPKFFCHCDGGISTFAARILLQCGDVCSNYRTMRQTCGERT